MQTSTQQEIPPEILRRAHELIRMQTDQLELEVRDLRHDLSLARNTSMDRVFQCVPSIPVLNYAESGWAFTIYCQRLMFLCPVKFEVSRVENNGSFYKLKKPYLLRGIMGVHLSFSNRETIVPIEYYLFKPKGEPWATPHSAEDGRICFGTATNVKNQMRVTDFLQEINRRIIGVTAALGTLDISSMLSHGADIQSDRLYEIVRAFRSGDQQRIDAEATLLLNEHEATRTGELWGVQREARCEHCDRPLDRCDCDICRDCGRPRDDCNCDEHDDDCDCIDCQPDRYCGDCQEELCFSEDDDGHCNNPRCRHYRSHEDVEREITGNTWTTATTNAQTAVAAPTPELNPEDPDVWEIQ